MAEIPAYWGPLGAFLSSVTWAVGSSGYSKMCKDHSPFAVNFARATVALPLFILFAFVFAGSISAGIENYSHLGITRVSWFALSTISSYAFGDVLFLWSARSLGVPGALAVASIYPIWNAMAGFVFEGEVLVPLQIAGLVIAVAGVIVVILHGPKTARDSGHPSPAKGVLLALACSVMWTLNGISVAKGGHDLNPAVANTVRMILALVFSFLLGRVFTPRQSPFLPPSMLRSYLWLFVFEAFGGSLFYVYGMAHSPLAIGAVLASLAPVLAVPVALLTRAEKFSFYRCLGIALTVAGITLLLAAA